MCVCARAHIVSVEGVNSRLALGPPCWSSGEQGTGREAQTGAGGGPGKAEGKLVSLTLSQGRSWGGRPLEQKPSRGFLSF